MTARKNTIDRALSLDNLLKSKFKEILFSEQWSSFLGEPEMAGSWIIWGGSGCGKTSFALMLAKELCRFGKVLYNSLEEGKSKSFQMAVLRAEMQSVAKRIVFLDKEPINELKSRLKRKKSADIIFIDSVQYTEMKLADYQALCREFPKKLFVWISHEKNREPDGRLADKIRYNAHIKIHVDGYRAYAMSRTGGDNDYFTIWEQGATEYKGYN